MTGKYLITTDSWFTAPDGQDYKSAWGDVEIVEDSFLGIKTNRNSANWFAKVGSGDKYVIIAGCQIHYSVRCEQMPYTGLCKSWYTDENGKIVESEAPSKIYIAQ